eukprot:CAMPEP_0171902988 /NCGR_PEP_ID=MMETSP0993-20121228/2358_1 /TAXON_ID=483369 /ORGANISM="non described non described, Strain CCMP2098" /LENGTH=131 /DNA_ID=CAMNT_0012532865 /DNA_START=131 /DNA_END=526 /DNA_ORIENTATION=+
MTEGQEQAQGSLQATLGDVKNVAAKKLLRAFGIWWRDASSTALKTMFLGMIKTKSLPASFLGDAPLAERELTNIFLPDNEFHGSEGVLKCYTHVGFRTAVQLLATGDSVGDCHGHQAYSGNKQSGELPHYE